MQSEEEWENLLRHHEPPHDPDDRFTESMWLLLNAARRNATYQPLYPGLSVFMLTVSQYGDFFDPRRNVEWFPMITAIERHYGVVPYPERGPNLLLTPDPDEAVTFAADLILKRIRELDGDG
ncbi:hypothetical protein [Streptomyces sp. NBC_01465]|uniref:hypothetical protein n=1 Tax=Streptomyces sp. NBC_01465 TaxID=2903878 RepID=UPI002E37CF2F|nr:hypothetical protein [Streptomyces sp. NBC_01465]